MQLLLLLQEKLVINIVCLGILKYPISLSGKLSLLNLYSKRSAFLKTINQLIPLFYIDHSVYHPLLCTISLFSDHYQTLKNTLKKFEFVVSAFEVVVVVFAIVVAAAVVLVVDCN